MAHQECRFESDDCDRQTSDAASRRGHDEPKLPAWPVAVTRRGLPKVGRSCQGVIHGAKGLCISTCMCM